MTELLSNYFGGQWQTGQGAGTALFDPVLGTELVRVDATGLDLAAGFEFAREQGGTALRALTYRERAALLGEDGMRSSPLAQGALRRRATFASREAAFEAYHGRGAFRTWSDDMLRDYLADGLAEAGDGALRLTCAPEWEAANFATPSPDAVGGIPDIAATVRIFKAEHASTAQFDAHEAAVLASGATIETVPGTSHFLPMERPALVRESLLAAAR